MMKKVATLIGLLLILGAAACSQTGSLEGVATPTPLPTPVVPEKPQYTVEVGTVVNALTFNGRISPVTEANLAFETSGLVSTVNVSEGDDVSAGTVLAELDISSEEKAVRDAEQALIEAQRKLEEAEAEHAEKLLQAEISLQKNMLGQEDGDDGQTLFNLERAVAQAQTAVNNAAQQYQAALSDQNADPDRLNALAQQLENAEQELLLAQDNLEEAQAGSGVSTSDELDRIQAELEYTKLLQGIGPEMQWAVEKAEQALAEARENLQKAQLIAPFDGRILSISIQRGSSAEPFQTAVVMAQLDALEITANLDASDLEQLSVGQTAQISLINRPETVLNGTVRTLPYPYGGGAGESDDDETVVRISIDSDANLTLGELAEVTITLQEKENVLWLPPAAIRHFQGRDFVVVQQAGGQQRVDVRLGIESEDRVEILEGVEAGQTIVGE
ncbi:MAG: HlyD family efflux transporter periplasmic adaptor subunit [Anaerolineaceae bacterium]|nr:HlyD family efflux transporter periplasmic adaptor subunit [Anaerolineaceae bacterium]